jgi:fructosamine-3-kinase
MAPDRARLFSLIRSQTGVVIADDSPLEAVGGGDINASYRLDTDAGPVFLKLNAADRFPMFEAEAAGLRAIRDTGAIRVPEVIGLTADDSCGLLLLEWLDMKSVAPEDDREMGCRLARLHRNTAEEFGWPNDNFIGSTGQSNTWTSDWTGFYRDQRLLPQLELAAFNGYGGRLQQDGKRLCAKLSRILEGHRPDASLLHGDLWGGNRAALENHEPVIFDPAAYYGDRETDLAMSRLFGGFGESFYTAYEEAWPLPPGHQTRCRLYQLYHLLNHLNLFGSSYLGRTMQVIGDLLAHA